MVSGSHIGQHGFKFSLVALWRKLCGEAEGQKLGEELRSCCHHLDQRLANTLGFAGHMVSVTTT